MHEDAYLLAISKPSGMISMPCESANSGTAAHLAASYLSATTTPNDVLSHGIVHRLDREVSGLLLLAKNKEVSKLLSKTFLNRKIKKTYIAIVHGSFMHPSLFNMPSEAPVRLMWPLFRRSSGKCGIAESSEEKEKAKDALTEVHVLASNATYSLLEVSIDTGRFHQIRAHLAYAGFPIVGDKDYSSSTQKMASGAAVTKFSPSRYFFVHVISVYLLL